MTGRTVVVLRISSKGALELDVLRGTGAITSWGMVVIHKGHMRALPLPGTRIIELLEHFRPLGKVGSISGARRGLLSSTLAIVAASHKHRVVLAKVTRPLTGLTGTRPMCPTSLPLVYRTALPSSMVCPEGRRDVCSTSRGVLSRPPSDGTLVRSPRDPRHKNCEGPCPLRKIIMICV